MDSILNDLIGDLSLATAAPEARVIRFVVSGSLLAGGFCLKHFPNHASSHYVSFTGSQFVAGLHLQAGGADAHQHFVEQFHRQCRQYL